MKQTELVRELEEREWIAILPDSKLIVFRRPLTRLVRALRDVLIHEVPTAQFEEWAFPRIVPEEILAKTGWLTYHREEAWLLNIKREHVYSESDIEDTTLFPKNQQFPVNPMPYVLDPIQCVCFYYSYYGKQVDISLRPICVYEYSGGWTHRYESHPDGLMRALAFQRVEFVWLATLEHSKRLQYELLSNTMRCLGHALGLGTVRAAATQFSCFEVQDTDAGYQEFYDVSALSADFERNNGSLTYPAYDIIVSSAGLHYTGGHDQEHIEIASSGRHDRLPKRFDITNADPNVDVVSGCFGIGLNRLAGVFLMHHGFDVDKWPRPVFERFEGFLSV